MGKSALLISFFGLIVFFALSQTHILAEDLPVAEEQSHEVINNSGENGETITNEEFDEELQPIYEEFEPVRIKDPMEPYNRTIFNFNDKTYYYVMKPVNKGYKKVFPEKVRVSIRNFFLNIKMPVRFFNCLFQGKFKGAGTEGLRFLINSTIGVAGFFDPAKSKFNLERQDEDFGQTLGKYKMGAGPYIELPLIGPSTLRDTIGFVGDIALNPLTLISFFIGPWEGFITNASDFNNEVSLDKGETYESITKPAVDPYIALQDAYVQNRVKKINE